MLVCTHCNKEVKNENSKRQHEIRCKSNPEKIEVKPSYGMKGKKGTNQYAKGKVCSEETKQKISNASKRQIWSDERRKNLSNAMKKAVEMYPDSYTSSNRGRTKQIEYNGVKFQGKWELEFFQYCESNNISIQRSNEWFEYEWNGIRKYFPDFYLKDLDLYIEVKGYETDRDHAKWQHFPKRLKIIRKDDIMAIRKGNCLVLE